MAEALSTKKRNEIEAVIYNTFSQVDKTGTNTEYYQKLFAKMSNDQFYNFLKRRLPFRLHVDLFKVEPKMKDYFDAFKVLNKPLLEKVKLPFKYINKDGIPVESKEALVIYINGKRMKQMIIKKNSIALEISKRDLKTGRLLSEDKGGQMSGREFESLAAFGLNNAIEEYSRVRADAMEAKSKAYSLISSNGVLFKDDVPVYNDDSLGKVLTSVYLLQAHIYTNLINTDYYTPYTLNKHRQILNRE